jgi:patatin-like phospholipase/acyl hydrolase
VSRFIRVLAIDGGGIRGIISGRILVELERILQDLSGDRGARIGDFFDLIAGTSTGGILACMLLSPAAGTLPPRYSAAEALESYPRFGPCIFRQSWRQRLFSLDGLIRPKYGEHSLEKQLRLVFGSLKLSQLLKPCLITAYNVKERYAHFFTQPKAARDPSHDFWVRDVVRATTAAPTYFSAAMIYSQTRRFFPLIDGGVFANNPALCAYTEACKEFTARSDARDMVLLSLGSGRDSRPIAYQKAKQWGKLGWAVPLIGVMFSGSAETVDYELRNIFHSYGCPDHYLRVNPEVPPERAALDDVDPANLSALAEAGARAAGAYRLQLLKFAELLLPGSPAAVRRPC